MKHILTFFTLLISISQYAQTDSLSPNRGFVIRDISTISKNSQPLLVVDGFAFNTEAKKELRKQMNKIDPNNIEKIDILKGDNPNTTAIYGERGAYGVILITTKKENKVKKERILRGCFLTNQYFKQYKIK